MKRKLPPLRKLEVRNLEFMTNKCIELIDAVNRGENVKVSMGFVLTLCSHHLHLYSRLIDANYVKRTTDPLVNLDTIH